MSASRNYLLVLPVAFYRIDEHRCATESAFATHLRMLLESLGEVADRITVAAPVVDADRYEKSRQGWATLDANEDRISLIPLHPAGVGRLGYLLRLPSICWRLLRAVAKAGFVHAGPSTLFIPRENIALLLGWVLRRRTVYVVDIDQRETARMNLTTGTWSRGVYLRTRYMHDAWQSLQTRVGSRLATVAMLKGRKLCKDYGRGRKNVHYLLDVAHDGDSVLTDAELDRRCKALATPGPLRIVYFGRLVAYKGVDQMIQAVIDARTTGVDVSLDIFGSGDAEQALSQQIRSAAADSFVRLQGVRPYGIEFLREVGEYDLTMACPLSEDTPRSAIDAQARGLPVLAYDTYYYRELMEDGGGVVCSPWLNPQALATKILELSDDREQLVDLCRRGVRFAAENTQESWLKRRARWTLGNDPTAT